MKKDNHSSLELYRHKIFRMVSVGVLDDRISAAYDAVSIAAQEGNGLW